MPDLSFEHDLNLKITYRPEHGTVALTDQWEARGGIPTSFALVCNVNIDRQGRESLYREMKATVGQYLDIIQARYEARD